MTGARGGVELMRRRYSRQNRRVNQGSTLRLLKTITEEGESFMSMMRKAMVLAMAAVCLFAVASVSAQQDQPVYPVGSITFETTSIAAGLGVSWGNGTFSFQGKQYPIKIEGPGAGVRGDCQGERQRGCLQPQECRRCGRHLCRNYGWDRHCRWPQRDPGPKPERAWSWTFGPRKKG